MLLWANSATHHCSWVSTCVCVHVWVSLRCCVPVWSLPLSPLLAFPSAVPGHCLYDVTRTHLILEGRGWTVRKA